MKLLKFKVSVLLLFPLVAFSQNKALACAEIKTGVFYNYPKNTSDQYVDKRDDHMVYETNLVTGDTSVWQINWLSDCVYALKFVSGNVKLDTKTLSLLQKHLLVFEITSTGTDYYVYKSYLDKTSNLSFQQDTMWLSPKLVLGNSQIYKWISNENVLRKDHFADTSKYAVVYLYRPGKLTNSLGNYPVYLEDDMICIAKNNSGYIFKVFKEGPAVFKSRLFKDVSVLQIDIKFGQRYYVKSMIHWTISSRLYNFKLEMATMDAATGAKEFEAVTLNK
jgi:hypothetical protein